MKTMKELREQVTQDIASFTKVAEWGTDDRESLEELLVDLLATAEDLELKDTDKIFYGGLDEVDAVGLYIRLVSEEIALSADFIGEGPSGGWDLEDIDRHTAHIVEAVRLVNKLQKTYWDELGARV